MEAISADGGRIYHFREITPALLLQAIIIAVMFLEAVDGRTALKILGATASLITVLVCVRRRYLSSLSDVPGPFVASFSASLWQLWHILKGHTEIAVLELHQQHGIDIKDIHNVHR